MKNRFEKLVNLFKQINSNQNDIYNGWKNLSLAPEAFDVFITLPLRIDGELTPYSRAVLMQRMMDCVSSLDIPRFALKVREYQLNMLSETSMPEDIATDMEYDSYMGKPEDYQHELKPATIEEEIQKLKDYISIDVSMDEFDKKYGRYLHHDPIESSEEWERNICEVEEECDKKLKGMPRGMGFCFEYWSVKSQALLKKGIKWRNPHMMNPRVLFD